MELGAKRQNLLNTLQDRQAAGTIKQRGLNRLASLQQRQQNLSMKTGGGLTQGVKSSAPYKTPEQANKDLYTDVSSIARNNLDSVANTSLSPIDFNSLPGVLNSGDLLGERKRFEDASYASATQGYDEQKAKELEALNQQLIQNGIEPNSGVRYSNAMNDFNKRWDQRFDLARQNATMFGGQEMQRDFDMGEAGRTNRLNEQVLQRQMPINQLSGFMQLGQAAGQMGLNYQDLADRKKIAAMNARRSGGGGGSTPDYSLPSLPTGLVG